MQTGKPLIQAGWLRAFLLFIAIIILNSLFYYVVYRKSDNIYEDKSFIQIPYIGSLTILQVIIIVSVAISFLTVIIFCKWIDRIPLKSLGFSLDSPSLVGVVLAPALLGCGTMVLYWTGHLKWIGWQVDIQSVLPVIALMLLVALSEELVFRGYILLNLIRSFNKWIALSLSSLGFACMHAGNPDISIAAFANLIIAGMVLGSGYLYTKSLWFPILFHFAWNVFQGPVLGYQISGLHFSSILQISVTGDDLITGGTFGFEGSILSLLLLTFAFLLYLWRLKISS